MEPEVYVPMGNARFQKWWCHAMIKQYRAQEDGEYLATFHKKKLLKELYRKEYYEERGWNFTFRIFNVTVVEIGPWVRIYHRWVGLYGEKVTKKLPKVRA